MSRKKPGPWPAQTFHVDRLGQSAGGTAGAYACVINGIIKVDVPGNAYTVANEFICGRLALAAGLPVAPGAFLKTQGGQVGYAMLKFTVEGGRPPDLDLAEVFRRQPAMATAIAVFDCWIGNTDRNPDNVFFDPSTFTLGVYDFGQALLGLGDNGNITKMEGRRDRHELSNNCLAGGVTSVDHVKQGVVLVQGLTTSTIERVCDDAIGAGSFARDHAVAVMAFLAHRKQRLVTLLRDGLGHLPELAADLPS